MVKLELKLRRRRHLSEFPFRRGAIIDPGAEIRHAGEPRGKAQSKRSKPAPL